MSSRSWFRGSLVAGVLIVSSMLAAPASSQQSQQESQQQSQQPATTASQQPSAAEEIVVTARKREEDVQEVPVAVSVVTADELEEAAAADISELQTQVPNLAIYQGRNQSTTLTVFLRGIGQADPLWGVDPGVGLYLDDVYIARPQGALLDVYDVERIEVLRGPQGTLYGKNTIGGAIKYVSRALTDKLNAAVSVSPGNYGQLDVRASLGGALVPGKLRGRVAVASLKRDGYGENLFTGRDVSDRNTLAARGALDWLIGTKTKVQFGVDYTQDEAQPKGYERLAANPFCNTFLQAPCPSLGDRFNTQSGLAPLNGTDSFGSSIVVSSDLSDAWSFKSITAYRESDSENNIDFDTTPAPIVDVSATYYDEQLTQEFQFVYDRGSRLAGVLGLYYFDGEAGGLVKNNFLNSIFGTTNGKTLTQSIAAFGDGSFAVTPRTRLNVGLRATREEKNGIAFNAGYRDATFQQVTAVVANYDKTATFDSIAPRIGIDYQLSDSVLGYFSVNRGFKSGGFNVRAQATVFPRSADPFDDEVLTVGELGLKSVLLDRRLVLNSAVFHGKYEDIQVSTFTAYDSNNDGTDDAFFGNFLNAGSATMNGAEVEFDFTPAAVNWLNVNGFVSWLDLEPDDFLDANRDGFVDTQVITNAPEWTGGLRLNFDFPVAGGLLTASAGAAYRDSATLTNEGGQYPGRPGIPLQPIRQDAYTIYDAWLSWLSGDGHWRFGLAAKNLTDEAYLTNGYNIPALGILTGSYGAPATAQATIEYRFFR